MPIEKHKELKIASEVLDFTIKEFAEWHDTSSVVIIAVAKGTTKSARLMAAIDDIISKAEQEYLEHIVAKPARQRNADWRAARRAAKLSLKNAENK